MKFNEFKTKAISLAVKTGLQVSCWTDGDKMVAKFSDGTLMSGSATNKAITLMWGGNSHNHKAIVKANRLFV